MSAQMINPYAAPKANVEDVSADAEAEAIRRANLNHEASIRSIGTLYYLTASGVALGGLGAIAQAWTGRWSLGGAAILVVLGLLAAVFFLLGRGLRTLRRGARVPTIVLAVLGLVGFPLGTLINGYILWLMLSKKGQFILTPEYAAIVEATPQVKYRMSILVWIFLGLIVAGVLAAILIPMLSH
jgi:hypothetical protein